MKKLIVMVLLGSMLVGCALLHSKPGVNGKASKLEDKAKAKIEMVDESAAKINIQRLDKIGVFADGVNYSLSKDTNNSPAISTAKELNKRIIALADKPDFNEAKQIALLVDTMITNKIDGENMLLKKDQEIESLIVSVKEIQTEKEQSIKQYIALADKTASNADASTSKLSQMDQWGGIGAIWYGVHKLVIRLAWVLGIGTVLFTALRILSFSNPLAAEIFSIFSKLGSWVIHAIEYLIPKSVNEAELVTASVYNDLKSEYETLKTSIINQAVTPIPTPTITPKI